MIETIHTEAESALRELLRIAKPEPGEILVVGCSTSEIAGEKIGTAGSLEIAETLLRAFVPVCAEYRIHLAAQCCEHLNRALVIEKAVQKEHRLVRVNAIPQMRAGGAFAAAALKSIKDAVLVQSVCAGLGVDIGGTLIGMHLRPVAVPVRTGVRSIGNANLILARSRCPYIGGERAVYDPNLG
ncbi:MAG TPA: TIGR01440 family protein [Treponemataceae bacterium]|jgi:uncharacterized protein (TIGR01440 family)|nr:MAG: TIGR01440 family protein [Treponema sp.]HOC28693.1 TIGR01440 family protein [Treponemataceae bacterium]HQL32385.1 TIGR01440 family protein [Treponemataceae bacterium]